MKTPQFGSLKLPHATEGEAQLVFQGDPEEDEEEEVRDSTITTLEELQDTNSKLFSAPDVEDLPKTRGWTQISAIIP